jgi:hypothetical protein
VTTIEGGAFFNCSSLTKININCQPKLGNNIVTTLNNMSSCNTSNLNTLQVTLSQSLLDSFADDNALKDYIAEILALTTSNGIINAISTHSGTFNLDLSNTNLTSADIDSLNNPLQWTVKFSD